MRRLNPIACLALAATIACAGQNSTATQNLADAKPSVSCYSKDLYTPASGLPPCYDEKGNPLTQAQVDEPGFFNNKNIGYILSYKQSQRLQASASMPLEESISSALMQLPDSDAYVLDISDSMLNMAYPEGLTRWQIIARQSFPPNADLYVFGGEHGLKPVTDRSKLESLCCDGSTPLWPTAHEVAETGKYRKFTILTDGDDNGYGISATQVVQAAKARGVRINIIGGLEKLDDIKLVTGQTGGEHIPIRW